LRDNGHDPYALPHGHGTIGDTAGGTCPNGIDPLGNGVPVQRDVTDHRSLDDIRDGGSRLASITGCLLGGAVGDALGAAVEFLSTEQIRTSFGPDGIQDYAPAYGRLAAITDDTQMTLFTAEGLIRSDNLHRETGNVHRPTVVYHAYLRWLETQGMHPPYPFPEVRSGWLLELPDLRHRRAPGTTCLTALESGVMGTIDDPLNDRKGCGGVMRVAPAGLIDPGDPFRLGCELAAITHGHPSGYLAAGILALVIDAIVAGHDLEAAITLARDELRRWPGHKECLAAVESALRLADEGPPTPERVARLGEGWVAEEALAISLYCALTAGDSFERGVLAAVNHSGDSDSTGAITGNILGALLGPEAIPQRWLEPLELRPEIEQVARDLYHHFGNPGEIPDPSTDWERYPGW